MSWALRGTLACLALSASALAQTPSPQLDGPLSAQATPSPLITKEACKALFDAAQQRALDPQERATLAKCSATLQFGEENTAPGDVNKAVGAIIGGPGANNDVVGVNGWLRSRLGF